MLQKSWMSWIRSYMANISYKIPILEIRLDPRSAYTTDTIILFFKMAILRTKLLPWLPV